MHTDQNTFCTRWSPGATRPTQTHSLSEGSQLLGSTKDRHQHWLAVGIRKQDGSIPVSPSLRT